MFLETIILVFKQIWPMLVILSVVLISIRITDIIINKKKFNLFNDIISFVFLVYVLMIFHVVTFHDVDWSTYNLNFFREILRYEVGSSLFFRNILGNIVMFIPFGLYLTYYFKLKKPYLVLLLGFILSLSIEITQFFIGRVFDVDDILLNVIGAGVGFYIYDIGRRIAGRKCLK